MRLIRVKLLLLMEVPAHQVLELGVQAKRTSKLQPLLRCSSRLVVKKLDRKSTKNSLTSKLKPTRRTELVSQFPKL